MGEPEAPIVGFDGAALPGQPGVSGPKCVRFQLSVSDRAGF